MKHLIFVYGTLRAEGSNAHRLAGAHFLCPATIKGKLYKVSWYPGVMLDTNSHQPVYGEVYEVTQAQLDELDIYEGVEYQRVRADARTNTHETIETWVWEYLEPVSELKQITSGDWLDV